jgi:23S rRNA (guanosine2251-2'-O)-methyltransferase
MLKMNAAQLRTLPVDESARGERKTNPITILCDNVLDTYNVGSIFRLADAISAEKVILCGATETPPNSRIKKASINTWQWVTWEHAPSAKEALENLKSQSASRGINLKIYVVEQDEQSKPFDAVSYEFPCVVVVGNETNGVGKEVLDLADEIVELPMWGVNTSLNVMVSCGIVLYKIMEKMK